MGVKLRFVKTLTHYKRDLKHAIVMPLHQRYCLKFTYGYMKFYFQKMSKKWGILSYRGLKTFSFTWQKYGYERLIIKLLMLLLFNKTIKPLNHFAKEIRKKSLFLGLLLTVFFTIFGKIFSRIFFSIAHKFLWTLALRKVSEKGITRQ